MGLGEKRENSEISKTKNILKKNYLNLGIKLKNLIKRSFLTAAATSFQTYQSCTSITITAVGKMRSNKPIATT